MQFNLIEIYHNMHGNTKVVARNTLYAFIIKGGALVISFLSAPLFIKYFDNMVVLGLWYTMLSMLTWFLSFDLGVGNGIRNHLVKAIATGDRENVRNILSSGWMSVASVTLGLSLIGTIAIFAIDLNELFNVSPELISPLILRESTLMVFAGIMARFMLTTVSSMFYALQRSSVNSFLALCVSVLQLLFILIFNFDNVEESLWMLSLANAIIANVPMIIAGIYLFFTDFKDCRPRVSSISCDGIRKVMSIGLVFFFCQICYLILINANEFFISHFWTPQDTAYYSFYFKIAMLLSMMVSLSLTPMWSMITKAQTEKNYVWLAKSFRALQRAGLVCIVLQFLIIPFLQTIFNVWLGKDVLQVDYTTALCFACFGSAYIYSSILSTIVCGLARMRLQSWCYGVGAFLKIVVICFIAQKSSYWPWTVWINVLVLGVYCILEQYNLNRYIKRLQGGE